MSNRKTIFNVTDHQLGKVKIQEDDGQYFLFVGDRDIQVDARLVKPQIVASGTRFSDGR